ncbi:MAG: hypothetical protein HOP11_02830 [Saprospiraceae bacterium]|nr:hypothetical protein [Saprospiraceae bacterium]
MLFAEEELVVPEIRHPKNLWSDKILSQDRVLQLLHKVVKEGNFPHCSLISGPAGSGQLLIGLHLAQMLLCKDENKPCGTCQSCYKVSHMIHPDLNYSFPTIGAGAVCVDFYQDFRNSVIKNPYLNVQNWLKDSDAENKQANITAAEAKSIIERMAFKPFESDCSVMLIWLPEYLGKESNILLKLLEEPPGNSYLILLSEDSKALLSTVKSRTQEYQLGPVEEKYLTEFLMDKYKLAKPKAEEYALASGGNVSMCLNWIEEEGIKHMELIQQMFKAAYVKDPLGYMAWIEKITALNRDEIKQFFSFLNTLLDLCLRLPYSPTAISGNELISYASKISTQLNPDSIEKIVYLLDESSFAIQRNANIRILLLDFLIKLSTYLRRG